MKFIRERVLAKEPMVGTFLTTGSSTVAEIVGCAGFDWVLIDLEHGSGDYESLVHQLQALESTPVAPVVRIANNDAPRFKRVLDLGISGVMVPYISSPQEAEAAVSAMRYPPAGIRGVARSSRSTRFGADFKDYFSKANTSLLTVIQIENEAALNCVDEIAQVDGVDVLLVGPLDLSVNLGIPEQFDHPKLKKSLNKVLSAVRKYGKVAGIQLLEESHLRDSVKRGFTFISAGSDTGLVASGAKELAAVLKAGMREYSKST
jgi:4-hydroxy-2-oxoheptanedioate aldolase